VRFYAIRYLIPHEGPISYDGLYKIIGRWSNMFDVLYSFIDENTYYVVLKVMSEEYVHENLEKLLKTISTEGLERLYDYLSSDYPKYPYDGLFSVSWEDIENRIELVYSCVYEGKMRVCDLIILVKNKNEWEIKEIHLYIGTIRNHYQVSPKKLSLTTIGDLKQFKSLREFHNFLLEVIE